MLRSILVPLDGSDFAEHALPIAAALAQRSGAVLHLVHVHLIAFPAVGGEMPVLPISDVRDREDEQAYLCDVGRRIKEHYPVQIESSLLEGDTVSALADFATRKQIDQVVLSTHARGAFARFWLGSVADDLAAALEQPLLLVRPGEGKPDLTHVPAFKSIVVSLDGSPEAEQAIDPAVELGKLFDAEFNLVRVNRPGLLSAYLPEGAGPHSMASVLDDATEIERREAAESAEYLAKVAQKLALRGVRARTHVVVEEAPAAGILAEAQADHADLIAIETHGRRGLARMFYGSVSDEIVRSGAAPVLLHHATHA